MSQSPNKLSIQVKLKQIPAASEPEKGEVTIRWGRLFGAFGVLGGLIAAAMWFLSLLRADPLPPQQKPHLEAMPPMLSAPAAVTAQAAPALPGAADAVPVAPELAAALTAPSDKESLGQRAEASPDESEEQAISGDPLRSAPPTEEPHTEEPSTEAIVHVLSERITHAQLSLGIQERQPTDVAPAVIDMGDETLITVYFFTELMQLRGNTLHYDWYLDGKRKARVVARPQSDAMTAYSSKHIDQFMRGQWLVKVQTAAGEPLARGEFEVR